MEKIGPEERGHAERDVQRVLRATLRRVNEAARYIDDVTLHERKVIQFAAQLATFLLDHILSVRKGAAFLFDLPALGAEDLQDEHVMIVPVRRKTFTVGRCQVQVRLKGMTDFLCQGSAEQPELRLAMVPLIQHQRASIAHVGKYTVQTTRGVAL